ncbi:hypothetical protein Pint_08027 [Pistacia integerrima]|uniref:Uncharacterized protein n=1 Tax=Pistacia integerrima TaxID=434235 RepID=A0ACC0XZ31_9ROSI|nr:hypothetical protein Pint_08027 [Pistacia integerrima]
MATIMAVIPMPLGYNVKSNTSSATLRSNISRNRKSAYPTVRMKTRIHRLVEDHGIVLIPGCYDALSAAIVQKLGFHAGFISGYALSATLLGKPDFGLITRRLNWFSYFFASETGGGSALNVQRTIKELIAAGAAGCCIEIIPAEEHAVKIASARDAIGDSDFFLMARTDARVTSGKKGLSDAIARLIFTWRYSFCNVGADVSFVEAPRDDKELEEIGRKTKGYRVCDMYEGGVTPLHTPEEVKAMGFHLIVHPLSTVYASARALLDVLKILKENGTTRNHLHKMATFEDSISWLELETRYLNLKNDIETKS